MGCVAVCTICTMFCDSCLASCNAVCVVWNHKLCVEDVALSSQCCSVARLEIIMLE